MTATRRDFIATTFAVAATATAVQARAAAPAQAACERLADGRVRLSWSGPAADIKVATRPDGPFTLVASDAKGQWTGPAALTPRPYFQLASKAGATEVAERVLPLKGGRNFRDMGGYRTADGRTVRWGQLFRSGTMTNLTTSDYAYLRALGIQVICDFRTTAERTQEPTAWQGEGKPEMFSRDYTMTMGDFLRDLTADGPTAASVRAHMTKLYAALPYDHADSYRRMFAELVAGRTPLAFNCSAGKDRTGVGAGLLLTALGVTRDQVLSDYALTEKVVNYEAIAQHAAATGATPPAGLEGIAKLSPEVRAPLMRSDPAYLEAAFQAIEQREGSIPNFLDKRLGVSAADVATLRQRLLKRA